MGTKPSLCKDKKPLEWTKSRIKSRITRDTAKLLALEAEEAAVPVAAAMKTLGVSTRMARHAAAAPPSNPTEQRPRELRGRSRELSVTSQ